MVRGSKRIAIACIVFLALTAGANPQLRTKSRAGTLQKSTQAEQPTDPNGQRRSLQETIKETVNPTNRDYGLIFNGWQDAIVRYTIASFIWWSCVAALILLIAGAAYFWWYSEMWGKRQACFERAAAVLIGQRNTAIEHARDAIRKHNELVDRWDRLHEESSGADQQVDAALEGVLVADHPANHSQEVNQAPNGVVVVLDDSADVEKQALPGETAAIYKIKGEEFIKKEDAARQLEAEKQRSRRISARNRQLQDTLFQYEK